MLPLSLTLFTVCFALIVSHYFLFPCFLALLSLLKKKPFTESPVQFPIVSVIIAAYNESKVIEDKIRNSLALDYPKGLLELIVVTDGSTDDSFAKARAFESDSVTVIHQAPRRGKSAAMNRGVNCSNGDILLFTDANNLLESGALMKLVRHFADPQVGAVSGRKQIYQNSNRAAAVGDRSYWQLESKLKSWESAVGSISTGDGEIFAVRKCVFNPISPKVICDDMEITLSLIERNFRVLYEPEAIAYEEASKTLKEDFKVKARMVYGGYQSIQSHLTLLSNPLRFFSLQFALHKTLRYMMPLLLITLFLTSWHLALGVKAAGQFFFGAFLLLQGLFYLSSLAGLWMQTLDLRKNPLYFPLYFSYMNYGALVGLYYFLAGSSLASVWTKAER